MKAKPLRTERRPARPVAWVRKPGSVPYRVNDGDTWGSVSSQFVVDVKYLIFFNFHVSVNRRDRRTTSEVNWYLREYVGCNVSTDGGLNWAFSSSADPGIIYIPATQISFEGDGVAHAASRGVGPQIEVPQYSESSFLDLISKIVDVYGVADWGIGVSGVELALVVEGGMIVAGAVASIAAPFLAIGAPTGEALQIRVRENFFTGYAMGLVMGANGASSSWAWSHAAWFYPPVEVYFSEKAETFRRLHNAGVKLGIKQGQKFNSVDKANFFTYLNRQLKPIDREYYNVAIHPWDTWSARKVTDYYQDMSNLVKRAMIDNDLKLKFQ